MDPASWFTQGGPFMMVVSVVNVCGAALVLLALVLAFMARFTGKMSSAARLLCSLSLVVALIPACAGLTGQWWGERQVTEALEGVSITDQDAMSEVGYATAEIPRNYGCGSTLCCVLPALFAVVVVPRRRRGWEDALETTHG